MPIKRYTPEQIVAMLPRRITEHRSMLQNVFTQSHPFARSISHRTSLLYHPPAASFSSPSGFPTSAAH
jgi:hypothetical protein